MSTLTLREGTARQLDYWWTVYKRTWRGSIISSFVSPTGSPRSWTSRRSGVGEPMVAISRPASGR